MSEGSDNKERKKPSTDLLRLAKDTPRAQVPVDSLEYQNFLKENARVEQLREEQGGLKDGDLDEVREATNGVSKKAKDILKNSRSS